MKSLIKKSPDRRDAFTQAYEREIVITPNPRIAGGDWEYQLTGDYDEDGNPTYIKVCVHDDWDLWNDCDP